LTNVIKNASEYSPDGGLISISSGSNPICSWISVTDSGNGISNTDIARIFKQFEGSRSDKGYGVGLPLALAIMRGQNGDIEVDGGGNGVGATFTLKFYK
jgi:signal transduction histidine kinase